MESNKAYMDYVENDIQNDFQSVFGWYLVINRLTENDITKHEIVYKKNVMEALNQLSFLIEYDKEQIRLQKKLNGAI
jgi:hypothetical protein